MDKKPLAEKEVDYGIGNLVHGTDNLRGRRQPRDVCDELVRPASSIKQSLRISGRCLVLGMQALGIVGAQVSLPLDGVVDEAAEPLRRAQNVEAIQSRLRLLRHRGERSRSAAADGGGAREHCGGRSVDQL